MKTRHVFFLSILLLLVMGCAPESLPENDLQVPVENTQEKVQEPVEEIPEEESSGDELEEEIYTGLDEALKELEQVE